MANEVAKSSASKPLTVGRLRNIMADLPDDALILLDIEDEEFGRLTHKAEHAAAQFAEGFELDRMNFDISYFVNKTPTSKPVLIISHDNEMTEYVREGDESQATLRALKETPDD
jgi:hypothetical protein